MLEAGTTLQGRFAVDRVLGQGGMGAVYLVRHSQLSGRPMAIKEMVVAITDPREREDALNQFRHEAEMLFDLQHPGLTRVSDFFEENGNQYLVMEYVDGATLQDIANSVPGFLPISVVCEWMEEVCDVLDYLHTRNPPIVLRDLKPSNIMVDAKGRVRLIDFGIARVLRDDTHTSTFIKGAGTAGFAPLEQYIGRTDHRADIYALGATFYVMLTRVMPPVSIARMSGEHTVQPSEYHAAVTAELEKVVLTMMAVQRDDRYSTIADAHAALKEAIKTLAPEPDGENLIALNRICPRCSTRVMPLATICGKCGTELQEKASGAAWPTEDNIVDPQTQPKLHFCTNCHIPLVPLSKKCVKCGSFLPSPASGPLTPERPSDRPSQRRAPTPAATAAVDSGPTRVQEPEPATPTVTAPAPAQAPSRPPAVPIAIAAVLLACGGGWFFTHRQADLKLTIDVPGATVSVDQKVVGNNVGGSVDIPVDAGTHDITVKLENYEDFKNTMTFGSGQVVPLNVAMKASTVDIQIVIKPVGLSASVTIDDKKIDTFGSATLVASVGQHRIKIECSGYLTTTDTFTVTHSTGQTFSYTLNEAPGVHTSPDAVPVHPL